MVPVDWAEGLLWKDQRRDWRSYGRDYGAGTVGYASSAHNGVGSHFVDDSLFPVSNSGYPTSAQAVAVVPGGL